MQLKLCLLVGTIFWLNSTQLIVAISNEAVIECGNIHHIELQNFPQANASFSNGKCRLTCWIGNTILATDSIYEGRSCPEDSTGMCRNGQCIGGQEDALRECGQKHNLDFHKMKDHKGTAFTNDQCMLKCVLDGTELSTNLKHEGSPCPTNPNGVCRSGTCSGKTTPTQLSFSPSKIQFLNISLESTVPPLKEYQYITLWYYENNISISSLALCAFYEDPKKTPNLYFSKEIKELPSKLTQTSRLEVNLREINSMFTQLENFYSLLDSFYRDHKLNFGEKEDFITKTISIYESNDNRNSTKKLDVQLRFTIVFSQN